MQDDTTGSDGQRWESPSAIALVSLFVLCLSLAAGILVYRMLLEPRGSFGWDEAAHAFKGLLIAHDLRQREIFAFLLDSYRAVLYPPLHSWLLAAVFLVAHPTPVSAGLVGIACYVATSLILYAASFFLNDHYAVLGGMVAAVLYLSSPLLMAFAPQTMLEIPGLAALSLSILIYLRLLQREKPAWQYVWLGLSISLTYFVRMPYGVVLAVAVLVFQVLDVRFRVLALFNRRNAWLIAPMVIIFLGWFAYPPKLTSTWTWLLNYPNIEDPYSVLGWLFYPLATVRMAGSIWMFAILVAALVYVLWRYRGDRRVLLLAVLISTQFLIGELYHNKQDRYLFPMLPPVYLLVGLACADLWWRNNDAREVFRFWLPRALTLLVLVLASTSYVQTLHGVSLGESIEMTDAAEIAAYIKDGESTLVIGSMDVNFPDPPTLDWYLVTEAGVLEAPHAGSSAQIEEERRIRYLLSGIPFPARWNERIASQLARYDQPAGARTLYLGLPRRASYSQSPEGFDEFFQQMTRAESIDRVIVVTSTLPSASYPLEYVSPSFDKAGFKHGDGEVFEKRHTRIDVYDK